jgi:translation initiation factor IF-2
MVANETSNDLAGLLQELAQIAYSDIRRIFDANGKPKPLENIDPRTKAAIGRYVISAHGFVITFGGKTEARELLLRHFASKSSNGREPNQTKRELLSVESEIDAQLVAMTKGSCKTRRRNRQRCSS